MVKQADGREVYKIDPFATAFEKRPNNAAVIQMMPERKWRDKVWQNSAKQSGKLNQPLTIYEVHTSSWACEEDGTHIPLNNFKKP